MKTMFLRYVLLSIVLVTGATVAKAADANDKTALATT
jgi:hypothetical protein